VFAVWRARVGDACIGGSPCRKEAVVSCRPWAASHAVQNKHSGPDTRRGIVGWLVTRRIRNGTRFKTGQIGAGIRGRPQRRDFVEWHRAGRTKQAWAQDGWSG